MLAAFLFTGDDVFKKIESLSGGERGRLSLAKLMLSESNFLILDEPTNHLDIMSKEILEDALNSYTGTVLYVSHDRYFINRTAGRILELHGQLLTEYQGNYEYYLEKKNETASGALVSTAAASSVSASQNTSAVSGEKADSEGRQNWKNQKEQQAALRKKENDIRKCEEAIETLENRNVEIDLKMADPEICTNVAELQKLSKEKEHNDAELETLYEKWEHLSES